MELSITPQDLKKEAEKIMGMPDNADGHYFAMLDRLTC